MPTISSSALQTQLDAARSQTDRLFDLLNADDLYERPVQERHRLIFYLGHLEAFDWNLICRGALRAPSFNPRFDKLFEFGIDPEPGQAPSDTVADWPPLAEVRQYTTEVRRRMDEMLGDAPLQRTHVAIEHRWMHAETFAYLLHNLPFELKRKPQAVVEAASGRPDANRLIAIPRGTVTLGQARGEFGWDNEFAQHRVGVADFAVSRYKVTNGEYLAFVKAGANLPHFWTIVEGAYYFRGMFELIALPLDWPVWVTYTEATEYAQWRGQRLMTEAEFHRAAYGAPDGQERVYPWGADAPAAEHGNFDFHHWDPAPVTAHPAGDSAWDVSQLVGNGWEWTSTEFAPFAGFQPFEFYPGYSANFFDAKHFVIKGGSPRTAAPLLRRSFRNWFRPDYPYVYAGFRLASN